MELEPGAVILGFIHPGTVHADTTADLINVALWSRANDIALSGVIHSSGARINKARDSLFRRFLETGAEWLWTVDTDMTLKRDTLQRLLAAAEQGRYRVVSALAFGYSQHPGPGKPAMFPSIFKEERGLYKLQMNYPRDTLMEVDGCGNYCMLLHREVVEAVGKKYRNHPYPWMDEETAKDGSPIGPDLVLCRRIRRCGYKIGYHTGIQCGHIKPSILGAEQYLNYMSRAVSDG